MKKALFLFILAGLALFACGRDNDNKTAIAILMPVTHPSMEQIKNAIASTMESDSPGTYRFDVYNAQGNKTLMRSEVEEISSKNYPLVFTLGASATQMMTEVLKNKGIHTPVVFTCVHDPVGLNIIDSEGLPKGNITGVKEVLDLAAEVQTLKHFKPEIKTILLVYNPREPGLINDSRELKEITAKQGLRLRTAEVFQTNELLAKVSSTIEGVDAVIILKDNTVVQGMDFLAKLCSKHKLPLMASDLDSPDRGAAFGYGVHEADFGTEAAKKGLLILKGQAPENIPVTPVAEFELIINQEAAVAQGVSPALIDAEGAP